MTAKIYKKALEESTFIIKVDFYDSSSAAVVPKMANWTLRDEDYEVVNSREEVDIVGDDLDSTTYIVLTGADLALPDPTKPTRYVLIQAMYDSDDFGSDLYFKEEIVFKITNHKSYPVV